MRRPAVIRAAGAHRWHPTTQTIAGPSLDNLVGSHEYGLWDRQAQRLRGLEVDDQLELGRLLDRDVTGRRAPQDFVDERRGAFVIWAVCAIQCVPRCPLHVRSYRRL